jgi:hypothetical protein
MNLHNTIFFAKQLDSLPDQLTGEAMASHRFRKAHIDLPIAAGQRSNRICPTGMPRSSSAMNISARGMLILSLNQAT